MCSCAPFTVYIASEVRGIRYLEGEESHVLCTNISPKKIYQCMKWFVGLKEMGDRNRR